MIQRRFAFSGAISFLLLLAAAGCDRTGQPAPTGDSGGKPTVASLSPAATDLIIAMGLEGRLVAVSNYEPPRQATDGLPRVGDYRTADWERIAQLRPSIIVTQYRADKMPDGFIDRATGLGIKVINRKIDSLDDAYNAISALGEALQAPQQAATAAEGWRNALEAVRQSVASKPRRRALIVVGESGLAAAGPKTFLSDLLEIAGGQNVLTDGGDYPTLDREKLVSLDPEVVLQLLPGASPQSIAQARQFWQSLPQLRAVKDGAIHEITDADALLPGYGVTRTARRFAQLLHPEPAGADPGTRPN